MNEQTPSSTAEVETGSQSACGRLLEQIPQKWQHAQTMDEKQKVAHICRKVLLAWARRCCTEERQKEVSDAALEEVGSLLDKLRSIDAFTFMHMEERSEGQFFQANPVVLALKERCAALRDLQIVAKKRQMILSNWAMPSEDCLDSDMAAMERSATKLDKLLEGREKNWIHHLTALTHKVSREAAERVLLSALENDSELSQEVSTALLLTASQLIDSKLRVSDADIERYRNGTFDREVQASNSKIILEEIVLRRNDLKLDEIWRVSIVSNTSASIEQTQEGESQTADVQTNSGREDSDEQQIPRVVLSPSFQLSMDPSVSLDQAQSNVTTRLATQDQSMVHNSSLNDICSSAANPNSITYRQSSETAQGATSSILIQELWQVGKLHVSIKASTKGELLKEMKTFADKSNEDHCVGKFLDVFDKYFDAVHAGQPVKTRNGPV